MIAVTMQLSAADQCTTPPSRPCDARSPAAWSVSASRGASLSRGMPSSARLASNSFRKAFASLPPRSQGGSAPSSVRACWSDIATVSDRHGLVAGVAQPAPVTSREAIRRRDTRSARCTAFRGSSTSSPGVMLGLGSPQPERLKYGSGLFNMMRNLDGAVGIAVSAVIINDQTNPHFQHFASHLTPANLSMERLVLGMTQRCGAARRSNRWAPGGIGTALASRLSRSLNVGFRRHFPRDDAGHCSGAAARSAAAQGGTANASGRRASGCSEWRTKRT